MNRARGFLASVAVGLCFAAVLCWLKPPLAEGAPSLAVPRSTNVPVPTASTLVIGARSHRAALLVQNVGSADMSCGFSSPVTADNGLLVKSGGGALELNGPQQAWPAVYCIGAAATKASVHEIGEPQ